MKVPIQTLVARRDAAKARAAELQKQINLLRKLESISDRPSQARIYTAVIVKWGTLSAVARWHGCSIGIANGLVRAEFKRRHSKAFAAMKAVLPRYTTEPYLWMLRLYEHKQLLPIVVPNDTEGCHAESTVLTYCSKISPARASNLEGFDCA